MTDWSEFYGLVIFRGTTNSNDIEVYYQQDPYYDLIVAHNRGNGGTFDYVGFDNPPVGTLFDLTVTFDGTDVMAYYDGVPATVTQQSTEMVAPLATEGWWIGKVDFGAFDTLGPGLYYFDGTIDEVKIWNTEVTVNDVQIDIKPGSCPNPINVKDKGVLPVAILGSDDFDVLTIDPASIRLEGIAPVRSSYEDVATPASNDLEICECTTDGPDGYLDLTFKFNVQEIVASLGEVNDGEELELTLTGALNDGTSIEGTDCIVIRNNKADNELTVAGE